MSREMAGVEGILFSEALAEEGAVVFDKAYELGLEGIHFGWGFYRSPSGHR